MSFGAKSTRSREASKMICSYITYERESHKIMSMWETPVCVRSHIVGFTVFFACCFVIYIFPLTLIIFKTNFILFWYLCLPILVVAGGSQNCVTTCIKWGYWDLSHVILPFSLLLHSVIKFWLYKGFFNRGYAEKEWFAGLSTLKLVPFNKLTSFSTLKTVARLTWNPRPWERGSRKRTNHEYSGTFGYFNVIYLE